MNFRFTVKLYSDFYIYLQVVMRKQYSSLLFCKLLLLNHVPFCQSYGIYLVLKGLQTYNFGIKSGMCKSSILITFTIMQYVVFRICYLLKNIIWFSISRGFIWAFWRPTELAAAFDHTIVLKLRQFINKKYWKQ